MSDLFWCRNVSIDPHNSAVLQFIPMLTYTVECTPGEPFAMVYETMSTRGAKPQLKTRIPAAYYNHLKRFLWRYYMMYKVYDVLHLRTNPSNLLVTGVGILQRTLVLLDTVVEQLLLGCKGLGEHLSETTRIHYFDLYLTTEFVVGSHDPKNVEAWRREEAHTDLDLERIDPFTLGESYLEAADDVTHFPSPRLGQV